MTQKRLVVLFFMLTVMIAPLAVHAQDKSAGDALTQRQQMAQQLTTQAGQLLEKYNIPFKELDNLLPFIAKNDQSGLLNKLGSLGLNEEQVGSILKEAAPLIEQGMSTGIIQEYLANQAQGEMEKANIKIEDYSKVMQAISGSSNFEDALKAIGLDGAELTNFVQRAEELRQMGLGADDFDHAARVDALMQAMGESKFAQEDWDKLINAYSASPEIFNEQLKAAGIDPEAFVAGFQEAYQNTYAEYGFDETSMADFQKQALLEEIVNAEGDPEALAVIGEQFGLNEDEITALVDAGGDPEALTTALEDLGYSSDEVTSAETSQSDEVQSPEDGQFDNGDASNGDTTGGENTPPTEPTAEGSG